MKRIVLSALQLLQSSLQAHICFANIFSNNIVLIAHKPIKIWGSAPAGDVVKIYLDMKQKSTTADKAGKWMLEFPALDYNDAIILKAIDKNKVIMYSNQIKKPIPVRYCWTSNPDVNLLNNTGLPAVPF